MALWGLFNTYRFKRHGVPVLLRVKGQKITSWNNVSFSPEFVILGGEYDGKTGVSEFGTSFGFHSKNAELFGLYLPESGKIESRATLMIIFYLSLLIGCGSIGFFCFKNKALFGF